MLFPLLPIGLMLGNKSIGASKKKDKPENPYVGTRYEEIFDSMPVNNREDSFFDRVGNLLGFRTGADKWQDEVDYRQQEYMAQIASLKSEDEYNSESARAARMRAAGQNPDLMGLSGASVAGEFSEPETSPVSDAELNSFGEVAGTLVSLGTGFTSSLATLSNLFLSLERGSIENEILSNENAGYTLNLLKDAAHYFDMPDIAFGNPLEGEEAEAAAGEDKLEASRLESERIDVIANSLFGNPRSKSGIRAKDNFIRSMNSRKGTISSLVEHLKGEASLAISQGDVNVARSSLSGRKSLSNAAVIEDFLLRSTMLDLEHDIHVTDIENRFLSEDANKDMLVKGLENEAYEGAFVNPVLSAEAINESSVADIAEAKERARSAALGEEQSRWEMEQYKLMEEYYAKLFREDGSPKRKYMRQVRNHFGYGPVNEPTFGAYGNAGASAGFNSSKRRSTTAVLRKFFK